MIGILLVGSWLVAVLTLPQMFVLCSTLRNLCIVANLDTLHCKWVYCEDGEQFVAEMVSLSHAFASTPSPQSSLYCSLGWTHIAL